VSKEQTSPAPWSETKVVGKPVPRVDAYERVSGSAVFTADISFPDMLHAAVLRCPYAHARVKRIDPSKAEKMPGVHAVITNATPGASIPWYGMPQSPLSLIFDPHCRFAGDEVAAVAATTAEEARAALREIVVEYEELPFVLEPAQALATNAPKLHPFGNSFSENEERGDVAKGFAEADVVLEETYSTSCVIHVPMEAHGSVARWEGDRLTVWDSTQGVFDVQQGLAGALKLPLSSVRVICQYMGGGFGSKIGNSKRAVIAALLARQTGRPVRLFLSREETFVAAGNRPYDTITLKAGVKKDGTLTALQLKNAGVVGAYPDSAGVRYMVMQLYKCPNAKAEDTAVMVNIGPSCAMRAPGFPQCAWALEQMMDALAEKIGMDPLELRLKNLTAYSQGSKGDDRPYTSTGLKQCLEEGAKVFGWRESRSRPQGRGPVRRGVALAAGMWGYQGEARATATVKLFHDGSANLNLGVSDLGTGVKTVMVMVVAEELGISPDRIQIEYGDTGSTQYVPMSAGSQTVVACAPAVRAAAVEVRRQLLEIAAEELKVPADELFLRDGKVGPKAEPDKAVPLSQLGGLAARMVIMAIGSRAPHPAGKVPLPFVAQFAEVEVNTLTGEVKLLRMVAAHDSGRVMNRLTYENQVFGGVTQGAGFALSEQRRCDARTGRVLNQSLCDYKVPTAMEAPGKIICLPIDPHDTECNSVGAKGLGEPATIPTAAAIANAIYHATGIRFVDAPITPMRMLQLLAKKREGR
jgi:CO/xanthine dehydrogenase Mo-binding subunit